MTRDNSDHLDALIRALRRFRTHAGNVVAAARAARALGVAAWALTGPAPTREVVLVTAI